MLKVGMRTMETGGEAVIIGDGPGRIQLELLKVWDYAEIKSFKKLVSDSAREAMSEADKPMNRHPHAVFSIRQDSVDGEDMEMTANNPELVCVKNRSTLIWYGASGDWENKHDYYDQPVDITVRSLSGGNKAAVGLRADDDVIIDRASVRASKVASGVCQYFTYEDNCEGALNK